MEEKGVIIFRKELCERGCCTPHRKGVFAGGAEVSAEGDALLQSLADSYVPLLGYSPLSDKKGVSYRDGINADGTISFGNWFSAVLRARKAGGEDGKSFPLCVSDAGYREATRRVRNSDLIVSPGLVRGMRLELGKENAIFTVAFHSLTVKKKVNIVESDVTSYLINNIAVSFPHKAYSEETNMDIAMKFLRFALSMSNFTFPNIADVRIDGLSQNEAKTLMEDGLAHIVNGAKMYANPAIRLSSGMKRDSLAYYMLSRNVRELSDEFLSLLENYEVEAGRSGGRLPYLRLLRMGKFSDNYLGDYLMKKAFPVPFEYGNTFEQTVENAISYVRSQGVDRHIEDRFTEVLRQKLFDDF